MRSVVWVQLQLKTQGKALVVLNPIATGGRIWWENIPEDSCLLGGKPALHRWAASLGREFVGKVACGRGRPGQCPPGIHSHGPRGLVLPPASRLPCLSRPRWLWPSARSGGMPSSSSFQNLPTPLSSSGLALITREGVPAHPLKPPPSCSLVPVLTCSWALDDRDVWPHSSRGRR